MSGGLDVDAFVVSRGDVGVDTEGNDTDTLVEVLTGMGFLGSPSTKDIALGGSMGVTFDQVLAANLDSVSAIQTGDNIECRDQSWTVTSVRDVRDHYRIFLKRVS